ncbi:MAG: Uncharacterized protein FD123_885 [Bacteroidetes bacterium]|nr:MAG: Uncharacterized protein FD123_885 [Bacteroidota bacterium]
MICLFFLTTLFSAGNDSSAIVLKKMHDTYAGKWYHTLTFTQTTEIYMNDSLEQTQTWYEAIRFPDSFRIDFGSPDSGNAVIWRHDSLFQFKKGKRLAARPNRNELLFQLGGMYFVPFDSVVPEFRRQGYDLSRFHSDTWQGRPVYVIGAWAGDDTTRQLWIDREHLTAVRRLQKNEGNREEDIFDGHQQVEGGWVETKIVFKSSDGYKQLEYYHDVKVNVELDERLFDPKSFGKWHWFKKQ